MAAYFFADIEVTDEDIYADFIETVCVIAPEYGGQIVLHSRDITPVNGGWHPKRVLLIRFDTPQKVIDCFCSHAYQELVSLRERSCQSRSIIIEE